jgi:putative ATP-dependent endonuclease of OLD family
MKLIEIKIENFRGVRSLHLPLDGLTVLIGENNTGKSTVLEAIRLVLTRGFGVRRGSQFTEYDFHLKDANATPQTADQISITLHFAEEQENEWPDAVIQQMSEVIQLGTTGLNHIWLQAKGGYQAESGSFETKWAFLNSSGAELVLKNATPLNLISRFVPLFFLSALRDASQEFGQRGQFWSGFLKSIQLPDDQRERIEEMLREVNTSVIGANAGLTEVTKKIADAGRLVPLDSADPVVLEAIPTRVFDMVGKIQVHLKSSYGAKLPLHRHGEGTQSLAVLMLFQAFASVNLAEAYYPESTPILALEEPEAHLHPSAIRSLGSFLEKMTGQILVSSHSGDLVSRVPVMALRRLYKKNGETLVGKIEPTTLTPDEKRHFDYHVRVTKGAHLFARCWLLVEGQSEFWLLPRVASLMDSAIDEKNFAIIEFSQGGGPPPFIKAAQALGIEWFVVADGDNAGTNYIKAAKKCLDTNKQDGDRILQLQKDLEHEFWMAGYDDVYKNAVKTADLTSLQNQHPANSPEFVKAVIDKAISRRSKPELAFEVAANVEKRGIYTLPQSIKDIITRVVQLAGG